MPKIEVNERLFFELAGRTYGPDELEKILPAAKAELDGWGLVASEAGGAEAGFGDGKGKAGSVIAKPGVGERVIKIELNDTNRPDLWSTAGLARQLRVYEGGAIPDYPFFSREGDNRKAEYRIVVDETVKAVRPFIAAFVISGKPIEDAILKDSIQTQEKLCSNFGRKRKTVSMGIYRIALIKWPVKYHGVVPESVRFTPLQGDRALDLREILAEHPKGREYACILEGQKRFPLLSGADGGVLSFPPIINSADIGAVQVGDSELLIELTGTDMVSVALSANLVACDFADAGYTVKPVAVEYSFDTPFGRNVVFPYYFQSAVGVDTAKVGKLLGKPFDVARTQACLARMGVKSDSHGQYVTAIPPEYRNDFLHPVDVIEDVMIGYGMDLFEPERPQDFTIGRLSPLELLSRRVKSLMVGVGYQEMIYNYLGSRKDYIERMLVDDADVIRISNPMSENFEYVRPSVLPSLFGSESVSSKAPYPHRIFEVGKVAYLKPGENYGTLTRQHLGFLSSHQSADFNEAASIVAAVLYYLGKEYAVEECDDPRFLPGRQARIMVDGQPAGIFGETHPAVLEAWGVTMPCAACELDVEALL